MLLEPLPKLPVVRGILYQPAVELAVDLTPVVEEFDAHRIGWTLSGAGAVTTPHC